MKAGMTGCGRTRFRRDRLAGLGAAVWAAAWAWAAAGAALPERERATVELYKRVSPAVVSVANKALVRDWFGRGIYEVPQGVGSGFVWDKKGHIISNFHVIYHASTLVVTLRDGSRHEAAVVGVDPDHDIAVLRINVPEERLTPIEVGESRSLEVGQTVLAIGNPFGLDASLSVGIVSALGRDIESVTGRKIKEVIQTDAAINPGNSGGPLLDSSGKLIGINTAIVSTSGSHAGVGFAVPVDTVRRVVPQLISTGRIQQVGLGIQAVPDPYVQRAGLEGVAILNVIPGGPAAKAGLRGATQTRRGTVVLGDILVEVNGQPVRNSDDLIAVLDPLSAGDRIKVVYMRGDQRQTAEVELKIQDP